MYFRSVNGIEYRLEKVAWYNCSTDKLKPYRVTTDSSNGWTPPVRFKTLKQATNHIMRKINSDVKKSEKSIELTKVRIEKYHEIIKEKLEKEKLKNSKKKS